MTATIYVPGLGFTDADSRAVDKAVKEYDERLYLKFNEPSQQWCVFIKMGPGKEDIPVFGFEKMPSPEFAVQALYKADTARHGDEVLRRMNKENAETQKPYDDAVDNANGEMAEAFEWAYRKMGSEKVGYHKSYRPVKKGV